MAIWLVRAGGSGEYEARFISQSKIYLTWDGLKEDICKLTDREGVLLVLRNLYPDDKPKRHLNHASQIWRFAREIQKGDWIVLPLKSQRTIQIGEVTGDYVFDGKADDPFFHSRTVKWIGESIPRTHFGKDLLNSFGAFLTVCQIKNNNAPARLKAMRDNQWQTETTAAIVKATAAAASGTNDVDMDANVQIDLEEQGLDRIMRLIEARFKGKRLEHLVEAILKAQGYTTYRNPNNEADGGADILAGSGELGFSAPRICVEVKSENNPIDRPTVDKLLAAVDKFRADQGLFVAWGGYTRNVQKELAGSFFKLRLWTQKDLLDALFDNYDKLDESIKVELPLKRIWTVAVPEEE